MEFEIREGFTIDGGKPVNTISTETSLSASSDTTLVTESAIKLYTDNSISDIKGLVVSAGNTGQVLMKTTNNDYDYDWQTLPGGGDMLKATYDTTDNGIVDNSEALGGEQPTYYQSSATAGQLIEYSDGGNDGYVLRNEYRGPSKLTIGNNAIDFGTGSRGGASSSYAACFGLNTSAMGYSSFSTGRDTVINSSGGFVAGKYNVYDTGDIFQVGVGADNDNRVNAFEITNAGVISAPVQAGNITNDDHVIVKSYLDQYSTTATVNTHISDPTIHYTQASIGISASQIYDLKTVDGYPLSGSGDVKILNNPTTSSYDWNTVITAGVYRANGSGANGPSGFNGFETVLVYTTQTFVGNLYVAQTCIDGTGRSLATRRSPDGGASWSSWSIYDSGLVGVTDGDKGDITVSSTGTVWNVDNDAITYSKMQNIVSNNVLLGNNSGAGSVVDELTASEVRTILNVADGAEANNISDVNATDLTDGNDSTLHYHATDRNRSNHTGTQTASTISDFDTEVSNNASVVANTAKVTNATHTGDVTGSGALTISNDAVTYAKMQNVVGNNVLLGNNAGAGGIVDELTAAEVRTILNVENGAEANNISDVNATDLTDGGDSTLHYHATDRNRSNHTGTQTASTISDFDTEVSNNSSVVANTAKVTNATHTGDVTGSGALTIANDAVTYPKMQNVVSNNVLLGNNSGAGSVVDELTAAEVRTLIGNTTAQWNANQIQGVTVDATTPTSGQILTYGAGGNWEPTTINTSETYCFEFSKLGSASGSFVIKGRDGYTYNMGYMAPFDMDITSIEFAAGISSASQTTSITMRLASYSTPNGTQYSYGAGTQLSSDTIFSVVGAQGSSYYRKESLDKSGSPLSLTAGNMLIIDLALNFWSMTDIHIKVFCKKA